ncbi:DUF1990 family protein [Compostimonas suwonensis]|uniref:Uncharacterized protein (UPF0548 family) n=1 Tax=Compostimonas suwonensis TaxID=1048394 RepID=A0A2M9BZ72_9MICO|nr:DUF1990 domain-containing protein [Compostimonas suwonensis]PJJ63366.1 uncharacterized protein (UPF0548 family) [Compostimonas suwonensis]
MRRSNFEEHPVTYGSVGATQADDLMQYPPLGYRPMEQSIRLGSGAERFRTASISLMTWGVQKGAGLTVDEVHPGTGVHYHGILYDESGTPLGAIEAPTEQLFDENGEPFIGSGMTARLRLTLGPRTFEVPVCVVYVVDEPTRAGFGYGSLEGNPVSGEESFLIELRDDDSVWFTVRSFSRPSTWYYRAVTPVVRAVQARVVKRYLRALHPTSGS